MERECEPAWCEEGGPVHDEVCDNAPMQPMTKHFFVECQEAAAKQAIEAYKWLLEEEGCAHDDAVESAIGEVQESAVCFAGIGSCGRGWCHHG